MAKQQGTYMKDIREVYAQELRLMQAQLSGLRQNLEDAISDGILPDPISWADVGSLKRLNSILGEALEISI